MNSMRRKLFTSCLLVACWSPAHAYLDPGTGSVIIQGVIATIAAVGVVARLYWHRLTRFFGTKKEEKSSHTESGSEET
jgi:hypothetical protein